MYSIHANVLCSLADVRQTCTLPHLQFHLLARQEVRYTTGMCMYAALPPSLPSPMSLSLSLRLYFADLLVLNANIGHWLS